MFTGLTNAKSTGNPLSKVGIVELALPVSIANTSVPASGVDEVDPSFPQIAT